MMLYNFCGFSTVRGEERRAVVPVLPPAHFDREEL